jgi:Na+/H+ antiporter NhaA
MAAGGDEAEPAQRFTGGTAWARSLRTPLADFLRTETGGAAVLVAGGVAALVWANVDLHAYESLWSTTLAVNVGHTGVSLSLRGWVNSGLMTLFFFVVGLEARREFDLGELRERRRFALPLLAGLSGAAAAIGVYLAINAGKPTAHGWGAAMSTDTAFALGLLALVGPRLRNRLRAFMLTVLMVDDVAALVVIAVVYSGSIDVTPLGLAVVFYAVAFVLSSLQVRIGILYFLVAAATWVALYESGVDPLVTGLAIGLLATAKPISRPTLERATELFRAFREQPTAETARTAEAQLRQATPPNELLQKLYHPWTSYVIVPLFALANLGFKIDGDVLRRAATSPIALGIFCGYVLGKPFGIVAGTRLVATVSRGRVVPPVGWAALAGGGTIAGIGFTVSLLISTLAFSGPQLEEAKVGILAAALVALALTSLVFRMTARLPLLERLRALIGPAEPLTDLYLEVDPERDHIRGPVDAPVTIVEYGDFECPYCGRAEPVMRELLRDFGDVRYVWRHLPLTDVHLHAQLAAEGAEAAAAQDAFWEMHDLLLAHQDALDADDLVGYAGQLGLDVDRFTSDLQAQVGTAHIADDVDSADLSNVSGTPTFFINGRRHYGAYDIGTLSGAVRAAGARALVRGTAAPNPLEPRPVR